MWVGGGLIGLVLVAFLAFLYLGVVLAWEDQRTIGANYYGLESEARNRFTRRIRFHARLLHPVVWVAARLTKVTLTKASFHHEGIAGPKGNCTPESFQAAQEYEARPEDVFVVTQMKCGTTWMQQIVHTNIKLLM